MAWQPCRGKLGSKKGEVATLLAVEGRDVGGKSVVEVGNQSKSKEVVAILSWKGN